MQPAAARDARDPTARVVRAMLFADVKGFSVLNDEQLLELREARAGCLRDRLGDAIAAISGTGAPGATRSSWCLLMPWPPHCAHSICRTRWLRSISRRRDCRGTWRCGSAATWARCSVPRPDLDATRLHGLARQPHGADRAGHTPGAVYVTEPFAAALVLAGSRDLVCDYMGQMPMAKDYGRAADVTDSDASGMHPFRRAAPRSSRLPPTVGQAARQGLRRAFIRARLLVAARALARRQCGGVHAHACR